VQDGHKPAELAAVAARRTPGIKFLQEEPRNVQDLLTSARTEVLDLIDFSGMQRVPTSFVLRDYRHVGADIVLQAPLRQPGKSRAP
jgi:hypothetical protein